MVKNGEIFTSGTLSMKGKVINMKPNEEVLEDLKKELLRIGSTKKRDYDLLKKKRNVYSTTISRRLKLSWPEIIKKTGLD